MLDIRYDNSENVKYDYSDFPVYIRRSLLSVFPGYTADSHWHDDIELICVLSGEMKYNINGTVITLRQGDGVLVNSRQLHFGFSDRKSECDFICVLFHPVILCTSRMFETSFVKPLIESNMPFLPLCKGVPWQKEILDCLYKMWERSSSTAGALYSQGLINLICALIMDNVALVQPSKAPDTKITTLKMMMTYIHENYKDKILLKDIANSAGVSKRTCESIFSKFLNCTPIDYLTDYRLKKSIELMSREDMSILEISIDVGFSSASYYAQSFRKSFGVSPGEYRKWEK